MSVESSICSCEASTSPFQKSYSQTNFHSKSTEKSTQASLQIACAKTANNSLNSVGNIYDHNELETLEKKRYGPKLNEFDTVREYINAVIDTVNNLSSFGKEIEVSSVAAILLAGLPSHYNNFILELKRSNVEITSDFVKKKLLSAKSKYDEVKNRKENNPNHKSLVTFNNSDDVTDNDWYIDSGANSHMSCRLDWMENIRTISQSEVLIANGDVMACGGIGNISISSDSEMVNKINDVVFVPDLATNLISVKQAVDKGFTVVFDNSGCNFYKSDDYLFSGVPVLRGSLRNGLYSLNCIVNPPRDSSYNGTQFWDRCLGYLCKPEPEQLENCAGIENDNVTAGPCSACLGNASDNVIENNFSLQNDYLQL